MNIRGLNGQLRACELTEQNKTSAGVILHHHREAPLSLVQHRHPGTPSDYTLSGSQVAPPVYFVLWSTRLVETHRPSAIAGFLIENGVNATVLTLLVE
jgi:hypothetical protein